MLGWHVIEDLATGTPAERVRRDAELLEAVRAGAAPRTARLWTNARALVVGRADARLPRFEAACAELERSGWPVAVRESGGAAVPHGPGVLSLSLAFRPAAGSPATLESIYDALCAPLERALARLGVRSERGPVSDAFCDGRYDLAVEGRKLAGTAQRWRAGPGGPSPERGAVLAHAVVLVDLDRAEATAALNRFYAAAGSPRRAAAEASITLREALGAAGSPLAAADTDGLVGALRGALTAVLRPRAGCA
jgi:octanoyl-[GcvH]:protein N-octanoyltransferase